MNSGNTCNVTIGEYNLQESTSNTVTITSNSTGGYMVYPAHYIGDIFPFDNIVLPYNTPIVPNQPVWGQSPAERIIEKIIIKEREEVIPMKKLYRVYVVSVDEELLLDGAVVIAEDNKDAEFAAGVFEVLKEYDLKPKDVTVICEVLGDVKVREEIKKVKLVKED